MTETISRIIAAGHRPPSSAATSGHAAGKLPVIKQSALDVQPIDWAGLPRRFLNPGELEVLVALIRSVNPRAVTEIGVNVGRTAKALLANVPGIESYQGVDVLPGYMPSKPVQRNETPPNPGELARDDPRFELILRRRGSLDLKPADLKPCDAVFIDGDHGREAVEHDADLAAAIVRPGGIIVFHDYHDIGTVDVRDVLERKCAGGQPILHVEGTWLAFTYQMKKKLRDAA
jgi:predicted O-methyltransferase YrrM